jgi:hypothetical protein
MPHLGFERTIPAFERALDRSVTVLCQPASYRMNNKAPSHELSGNHHSEPRLQTLNALSSHPQYTCLMW